MASIDSQPDEVGAQPVATAAPKARQALSRLKRELADEELSSPGTQKMLLEELERLDAENRDLKQYRDKYFSADKIVAVLYEKLAKSTKVEIISSTCLAVGAAALGYAPVLWDKQPSGWIAIAFGAVLIVAGVVVRIERR